MPTGQNALLNWVPIVCSRASLPSHAVQENMKFTHRSDKEVVLKVHQKAGSSCRSEKW